MESDDGRLGLFQSLPLEVLRRYASRIQLRNSAEIKGGKPALINAILEHEARLGLHHPLVRQYSYVLGIPMEREEKPISLRDIDLSTPDLHLAKFLDGIEFWPKKILQAEIEYTLKYDEPLPGWSDLDLLRYTMRFYPHRRIHFAERHKRLPQEVKRLLTKDPVSQVRSAALGISWENATCVQ